MVNQRLAFKSIRHIRANTRCRVGQLAVCRRVHYFLFIARCERGDTNPWFSNEIRQQASNALIEKSSNARYHGKRGPATYLVRRKLDSNLSEALRELILLPMVANLRQISSKVAIRRWFESIQ